MNKKQFKKLYSFYRKINREFRENLENSNYPCGYDDMICENFSRQRESWLNKNKIIKQVLNNLDLPYFSFSYQPITENFAIYRHQNSWEENGKIFWIKRTV